MNIFIYSDFNGKVMAEVEKVIETSNRLGVDVHHVHRLFEAVRVGDDYDKWMFRQKEMEKIRNLM